jgi:uncharacterized protein YkwD
LVMLRLIGAVSGRRRILTIRKPASVIGSAPGADFVLEDPSIAPRHARIVQTGNDYQLSDLGGATGVYQNGRRIRGSTLLRDRDEVRLGASTFLAELIEAPDGRPSRLDAGAPAPKNDRTVANQTHRDSGRRRRKKRNLAIAAILMTSFAIVGFVAAIYFINWDRLEDLVENYEAAGNPTTATPKNPTSADATNPTAAAPTVLASPRSLLASPQPSEPAGAIGTPMASAVPISDADAASAAAWLEPLNHYRGIAGLAPVEPDPVLSSANTAHARYLLRTYGDRIFEIGGEIHSEDPSRPGYSEAGDKAGHNSDIASRPSIDGAAPPAAEAIEGWIQTPFHRLWELNPALQRAGYGESCSGKACVEALDVESDIPALMAMPQPLKQPIEFPPPNSTIKLRTLESEWPDPLASCPGYTLPAGLPITLQLGPFTEPKLAAYSLVRDRSAATPLEVCGFTADSYTNPDPSQAGKVRDVLRIFGAIVIVPRAPLEPGRYTVSITSDRNYTWNFTIE